MTPKQKLFVKEYLVDLNATRAAISAGYSEKTACEQGSRLLRNVQIQAEVNKRAAKITEKLDISTEYILGMIKQTIERCSQGVEVVDREGNPTGEWKEDSFAVLKGCELLGRYRKLFTDKVEHSGQIENVTFDATHVSDEQLAAWEASLTPIGSDKG